MGLKNISLFAVCFPLNELRMATPLIELLTTYGLELNGKSSFLSITIPAVHPSRGLSQHPGTRNPQGY
jgi:hypothetical protein